MRRRRFIKTSVRAGIVGTGFALSSPSELLAGLTPQDTSRSGSNATETLARFIADFRYERLSPQAVEAAKAAIVDGVGVMLAGSTFQPLSAVMANYVRDMGGAPRCSVVG